VSKIELAWRRNEPGIENGGVMAAKKIAQRGAAAKASAIMASMADRKIMASMYGAENGEK
jgi:hypothetical protein